MYLIDVCNLWAHIFLFYRLLFGLPTREWQHHLRGMRDPVERRETCVKMKCISVLTKSASSHLWITFVLELFNRFQFTQMALKMMWWSIRREQTSLLNSITFTYAQ